MIRDYRKRLGMRMSESEYEIAIEEKCLEISFSLDNTKNLMEIEFKNMLEHLSGDDFFSYKFSIINHFLDTSKIGF